ncbi:DNA replication complex GINS protein SLD5, partial [Stegodyphus mimosarum]
MDYDDDSVPETESEELTTAAQVVEKLEEVWKNEKLAPDLLLYEGELVECLIDQIQHMENSLQRIKKEDFRLVFHKMELDRIKFILSSYLRTRLAKIEKFGSHLLYLEQRELSDPNQMSDEERRFAQRYTSSMKNYLHDAALKHMPTNMQSLKLEEIGCKPQMNASVFIKVKNECRGVRIEEFS